MLLLVLVVVPMSAFCSDRTTVFGEVIQCNWSWKKIHQTDFLGLTHSPPPIFFLFSTSLSEVVRGWRGGGSELAIGGVSAYPVGVYLRGLLFRDVALRWVL